MRWPDDTYQKILKKKKNFSKAKTNIFDMKELTTVFSLSDINKNTLRI